MNLSDRIRLVADSLSPLSEDYYVKGDDKSGSVLVCGKYPKPEGLGFAITASQFEDGHWPVVLTATFAKLMSLVEDAKKATA